MDNRESIIDDFKEGHSKYIEEIAITTEGKTGEELRAAIAKLLYDNWYSGTPTEALIRAMEDAGNIDEILILYVDKEGTVGFRHNIQSSATHVYLCEIHKQMLIHHNYAGDSK